LLACAARVLAAIVLAAPGVRAESEHAVDLALERAPGSEACPGPESILGAVHVLFPEVVLRTPNPTDSEVLAVSVAIHPLADGHEALLRVSGQRSGERTLVDHDAGCRGLADAIAVALVLMVDPDARPAQQPPAPEPPAATSYTAPRREADPVPVRLGAEGGALGSGGLLGNLAYGGFLGATITAWNGPTLRIRGLRQIAVPSSVELPATPTTTGGSGEVAVALWAVAVAACYRLTRGQAVALSPCLEFTAGSQHGEGHDFPVGNNDYYRPFLALGPSLGLAVLAYAGVELVLTAGVSANLWRQSYLVDAQAAQTQDLVGAYAGIGVGTAWTLGRPTGR